MYLSMHFKSFSITRPINCVIFISPLPSFFIIFSPFFFIFFFVVLLSEAVVVVEFWLIVIEVAPIVDVHIPVVVAVGNAPSRLGRLLLFFAFLLHTFCFALQQFPAGQRK